MEVLPGPNGKLYNDCNSLDTKTVFGRTDPEYEIRRKALIQDRGMTQAQFDGLNDFFGYLTSGSRNETEVIDIKTVDARMQELGPEGVKKEFDEHLRHEVEAAGNIIAKGRIPGASKDDAYWAGRYEPRRADLIAFRGQLFGEAAPQRMLTGAMNPLEKLTSFLR
jgi:hypothetical protein